jgi:Rho-binding antiterminator
MKYQPISCDYYDELTLLAMRRTACPIIYKKEDGTEVTVETVIQDIFTRNGEEFLLLPDGLEIRLDQLVSVAGKALSGHC